MVICFSFFAVVLVGALFLLPYTEYFCDIYHTSF